jgi:hypothetical protein
MQLVKINFTGEDGENEETKEEGNKISYKEKSLTSE